MPFLCWVFLLFFLLCFVHWTRDWSLFVNQPQFSKPNALFCACANNPPPVHVYIEPKFNTQKNNYKANRRYICNVHDFMRDFMRDFSFFTCFSMALCTFFKRFFSCCCCRCCQKITEIWSFILFTFQLIRRPKKEEMKRERKTHKSAVSCILSNCSRWYFYFSVFFFFSFRVFFLIRFCIEKSFIEHTDRIFEHDKRQ